MNEAKDEAGIRGRGVRLNFLLIIGASVVVIAGGLIFLVQANSSPGCADKGPCMLYFYADW